MNDTSHTLNENAAANAFSLQAPLFDKQYGTDTIIRYKRERVREHVSQFLQPHSSILELNAGTGEDAIFFARVGHYVYTTDISDAMQGMLMEKVKQHGLRDRIAHELCSFTALQNLSNPGPYDLVFSNFAGLNCTNELAKVLGSLGGLLKPGGMVTMVLLPKFCLWETLLVFKGKFRTAFRRFTGKQGASAHIEGAFFRCWYYNPSFILKHLEQSFELVALEGLCTLVPPSYITGFAEKHPLLYKFLVRKENKWKARWPWKIIGDYYIITLRKKS